MWSKALSLETEGAFLVLTLLLTACQAQAPDTPFPKAQRDVAPIVGDAFSTEDARDRIRGAAGGLRDDKPDRLVRVFGRRSGGECACNQQRSCSNAAHAGPPRHSAMKPCGLALSAV